MRIENLDGVEVSASEMPRLEDSDADGYVLADPTATGVYLFEENWLQAGVGSKEGDYKYVTLLLSTPTVLKLPREEQEGHGFSLCRNSVLTLLYARTNVLRLFRGQIVFYFVSYRP